MANIQSIVEKALEKAMGSKAIEELVERAQKHHDWTFAFVGGDIDTVQHAHAVKVSAGNALNFTKTGEGYRAMSTSLRGATQAWMASADSGATGDALTDDFFKKSSS